HELDFVSNDVRLEEINRDKGALGGDQRGSRGFSGIFGSICACRRHNLSPLKKVNLNARNDSGGGGRNDQPQGEDRNRVGEKESDEPAKRMVFFGLVFSFGLSARLLFVCLAVR